jgi:peptidoglycan/LPS O-acetylase OafA/YrhL
MMDDRRFAIFQVRLTLAYVIVTVLLAAFAITAAATGHHGTGAEIAWPVATVIWALNALRWCRENGRRQGSRD